jgi:hypothetical protein
MHVVSFEFQINNRATGQAILRPKVLRRRWVYSVDLTRHRAEVAAAFQARIRHIIKHRYTSSRLRVHLTTCYSLTATGNHMYQGFNTQYVWFDTEYSAMFPLRSLTD